MKFCKQVNSAKMMNVGKFARIVYCIENYFKQKIDTAEKRLNKLGLSCAKLSYLRLAKLNTS